MPRKKELPEGETQQAITRKRYHHFICELYPESKDHMAMLNYLENHPTRYKIAYILHDRDTWTEQDEKDNPEHKAGERKKPHYHVLIHQKDAQAVTAFVKFFSLWIKYAEGCNSPVSTLLYFLHDTPDSMHKARYQMEELKGDPSLLRLVLTENEHFIQFELVSEMLEECCGDMSALPKVIHKYKVSEKWSLAQLNETMQFLSRYQGIVCTMSNQIRSDLRQKDK